MASAGRPRVSIRVRQPGRAGLGVTTFLVILPSQYEFVKPQILSSPEISSFQETFSKILCTKISSPTPPSAQMRNALVGQNIGESERSQQYRNSGPCNNSRGPNSRGVVCYYCRKSGHVIRDYKKR